MNSKYNNSIFFIILLCNISFNAFPHYAYRCAELVLNNQKTTDLQQPFLKSIKLHSDVSTQPMVYALACGDIIGESNMYLTSDRNERTELKNIAKKIVYLRLGSFKEDDCYLQEGSECEKLLNNIKIKENKFCIIFNSPQNETQLYVMEVILKKNETSLETQLYTINNDEAIKIKESKLGYDVSFLQNLIINEFHRTEVITKYMHDQFVYNIAIKELARLSIINNNFNYFSKLWCYCTAKNISYILIIYIIGILCYKHNISIAALIQDFYNFTYN